MFLVPPYPSSKIHPGFFLLPPLCPFLCSRPPTSSSVWSPVVRPSEVYNPPADCRPNSLLLVSCTASLRGFPTPPPPRPVGLMLLGLWVGVGAKETAPPAMVLSSSTHQQASPGIACLCQRSRSLFDSLGARLSVCPLSPLSPYNRMCPNTLPPNGRVFSWSFCAPSPRWARPSCRLPDRLRSPSVSSPPPPYSLAIIFGVRSTLNRASSIVGRSVGEPAPRARTTGPGYCGWYAQDQKV